MIGMQVESGEALVERTHGLEVEGYRNGGYLRKRRGRLFLTSDLSTLET